MEVYLPAGGALAGTSVSALHFDGVWSGLKVARGSAGYSGRFDGKCRLDNVSTATANAGAATLPANPVGFITINVDGTDQKIPYYDI